MGAVFKVTPDGVLTNLYTFTSYTNGASPDAGVIRGTDGNLYGVTWSGGTANKGTVFQLTPEGVLTSLYSFSGPDESIPDAGLVQGAGGTLYGTTLDSGANNWGTVFELSGAIAPSTPANLTATHGNHAVTLSWTAASAAGTYNVYGGKTPGGESSTPIKTGVTGTSVTITGLRDGTTFYFKVAAMNDAGSSELSNEARAMPRRK